MVFSFHKCIDIGLTLVSVGYSSFRQFAKKRSNKPPKVIISWNVLNTI